MGDGLGKRRTDRLPRLPLEAAIDLTYRCNNKCRHCWLWLPADSKERRDELSSDEWRTLVDQARALGTRHWSISGGEPLLRPDFADIFEYATAKAIGYSLNTNGTLVTPTIARLLRRKGNKMVAVYGASADVYDRITGNAGAFEALLGGLSYLKEAGTGFTMQLIPMRDNWHQWDRMLEFAHTWSRHVRLGAAWLHMSACRDLRRNARIAGQRLDPSQVVGLEQLNPSCSGPRGGSLDETSGGVEGAVAEDDRVYADCIRVRRGFHVDPYGGMSFCAFIKDPALRFDLRKGTGRGAAVREACPSGAEGQRGLQASAVRTAWDEFIPSLAEAVHGGREYLEGCAACDLRLECRWCDAYGYLEHGRHGARVDYLCAVARRNRESREGWVDDHRRYFEIAGITVQVDSDLPFAETTLDKKFASFRVDRAGPDTVTLHHHFALPELGEDLGTEVYRQSPWAIYRKGDSWVYQGIPPGPGDSSLRCVAVFNADHSRGELYNDEGREQWWRRGGVASLTMFPSDQILLARLLADRQACFLHSGGLKVDGQGLLFVGHSDAGKSTSVELVRRELGERAQILCDDRNIVRRWPDGFRVHGTWSHGDVPEVSSASASLRALLFLEQDTRNELVPLADAREIWQRLLATLIRPMVTADWWHKELDLLGQIVEEVPCFVMHFDKSGAIVPELERLTR